MEVGVRLIGLFLRVLGFLLGPIFWLWSRDSRRVPPITNPLFLKSAAQLAMEIRSGELTSEHVVIAYIARMMQVDAYVNAVVEERYGAAAAEARAADRELAAARAAGSDVLRELAREKPLLGVPFTVKESCSLAGMSNAVGRLESAGSKATADGAAVGHLRAAGAIPLAVTATPELCLGWETTNLLHGTTRNPYDLGRTPGGSSGGEAALLASGASCVGVASDIAGSIRIPAAFCGVFGHKPTPGIVSIEGHIPTLADERYARLLAVGPMARRAADLPLLLAAMAGGRRARLQLHRPVAMSDLTVHYMVETGRSAALLPVEPAIKRALLRARDYLRARGATISDEKFEELEDSVEISVSVFFSMKDIPNMLEDPDNPKCGACWPLAALWALRARRRSRQALGFALLRRSQLFIPRARREHYVRRAAALADTITKTLGTTGVLLYPAFPRPAHRHGEVWTRAAGVACAMAVNVLGLPAACVPLGLHAGLPLAVQVIAGPNQDRLCLAVAQELEKGFGGWQPPH